MDKSQNQRTRRDIMEAFCAVVKEKPFEKITVADIAAKTGVSKITFYRYFDDKYALAEALQEEFKSSMTPGAIYDKYQRLYNGLPPKENYYRENDVSIRLYRVLKHVHTEKVDADAAVMAQATDIFGLFAAENLDDALPPAHLHMVEYFFKYMTLANLAYMSEFGANDDVDRTDVLTALFSVILRTDFAATKKLVQTHTRKRNT